MLLTIHPQSYGRYLIVEFYFVRLISQQTSYIFEIHFFRENVPSELLGKSVQSKLLGIFVEYKLLGKFV